MDKDEILARSRSERQDEGMAAAENRGRKIGVTAFCCVFIVIVLLNLFHGRPSYAPQAMFWAFLAAESYPKYKFTQNRVFLVSTVMGALACLAFLACFVLSLLG